MPLFYADGQPADIEALPEIQVNFEIFINLLYITLDFSNFFMSKKGTR